MSLFFRSQNRPHGASPRVVVHPYLYTRTGTNIQVGVYCEEPAPETAAAIVEVRYATTSRFVRVPITKGMRDSGQRATAGITTSSTATVDFYKSTTVTVRGIENSVLFEPGPQDLCPTLLFRIHLSASSSVTIPLAGNEYYDGFDGGNVMLRPITPLLESSSVSGVCVLRAGQDTASFDAEVEIARASTLLQSNSVLAISAESQPSYTPAMCTWFHASHLKADALAEVVETKYNYDSPSFFSVSLGAPTLGEYIKAGVSVFDVELLIGDVCFQ